MEVRLNVFTINYYLQIHASGIILHNLSTRNQLLKLPQAHKGKVSGLCFADGDRLLSCGVDRNIKLWSTASGASSSVRVVFSLKFTVVISANYSHLMFFQENQLSSA